MKMRHVVFILAIVGIQSRDVAAQTPVQPFDNLSGVVTPGLGVVVNLSGGRRTSGTVVSLSGDRIEIRRRRWNFRSEQLTFPLESVQRIEERDSTLNGTLLGLGAGAAAAWLRCQATRDDALDFWCLAWVPIAPAAGSLIGGAIDGAIRRPLYIASGARVQLRPIPGAGVGITATIGF